MYIWIGINVDSQLCDVKKQALEIDRRLNFKNSCFTLPLHISLKISLPVDDSKIQSVTGDIVEYYQSLKPFQIAIKGLEKDKNILWIRMVNNGDIDRIHDDLNEMLLERYSIGLHEYDLDYKFHTTLFMDGDEDKISKAYEYIKGVALPPSLTIDSFLIGTSKSGALGTYSVFKEIRV